MHPLTDLSVSQGSVAIHWFEQSCFAVKDSRGTLIQIDPYFPIERPKDRFIHRPAPLDESTLPTDFVLLTHNHGDHTCLESILRIWQSFPQVRFVGPEESIDDILAMTDINQCKQLRS
ncbi:MBL fold metallo-hydrolase [Chloroflexi bacterium TSY]|nr:MBL fold metallo-hydrolase [Chloroflexi bacterium TSY]